MNIHFLNIRPGEVTAGAYLVSITDIVNDCQQIGTGALLIVNNYILGTLWGNQCFITFDSHSKDEIGKISASGTAEICSSAVIEKLYKINILVKLPNDSLLPSKISKTKIPWECKKHN